MSGDLDHNTVHKLRAMLNGESEEHRDEARRLLNLVTDNRSVIELMGSAPACADRGCQLFNNRTAAARFGATNTLFLANLHDDDYDLLMSSGHVHYSGATGKGVGNAHAVLGNYIASFMTELPAVLAVLDKPVQIARNNQGFVLRVDRRAQGRSQ